MTTREEMIAASKKRFGESWEPLDLSTPEAAKRTYGGYWETSFWNPESGSSKHAMEIDALTAHYDKLMGTNAAGGGVLANDGSHQEWMRETVDKAEVTRAYAAARKAATGKWAESAAPDQMRTVAYCHEVNAGWDEKVRELEARAAEIEGFNPKAKGGGSCGSSVGRVQFRSGAEMVGMTPIALLCAALAYGAMYFVKHGF